MIHVEPRNLTVREIFGYLQGGIAPRPIALVSTLSVDGLRNLSPFSFFNAFGGNPPIVAFSPSRRQRDGTLKDTYTNLMATKECVIQAVTHSMVQQVSLASTEYPSDIDEFKKSGLTPIPSDIVKPPRVAESPFQMECLLRQMIPLGEQNGSGNLAICEVVKFHVDERIFKKGIIDPDSIDLVGRNSADYYTRASGSAIFAVTKPVETIGIGYDQLPEFIRRSTILTANNLGQLGNTERIPDRTEVEQFVGGFTALEGDEGSLTLLEQKGRYADLFRVALYLHSRDSRSSSALFERAAKCALDQNNLDFAWKALLAAGSLSGS